MKPLEGSGGFAKCGACSRSTSAGPVALGRICKHLGDSQMHLFASLVKLEIFHLKSKKKVLDTNSRTVVWLFPFFPFYSKLMSKKKKKRSSTPSLESCLVSLFFSKHNFCSPSAGPVAAATSTTIVNPALTERHSKHTIIVIKNIAL